MVADGRDHSIVQRGIDEALACRDMLTPVPPRPSWFSRVMAHVGTVLRVIGAKRWKDRSHRRPIPGSITESIRYRFLTLRLGHRSRH